MMTSYGRQSNIEEDSQTMSKAAFALLRIIRVSSNRSGSNSADYNCRCQVLPSRRSRDGRAHVIFPCTRSRDGLCKDSLPCKSSRQYSCRRAVAPRSRLYEKDKPDESQRTSKAFKEELGSSQEIDNDILDRRGALQGTDKDYKDVKEFLNDANRLKYVITLVSNVKCSPRCYHHMSHDHHAM